jgi:tetratricopeptide (TPR) repeat protein
MMSAQDTVLAPAPAGPYPGPRPFAQTERALFFGREREAADLYNLVLAYRSVLFYAQSGAGKTSLVNAGLLPLCAEHGLETLQARVGGQEVPSSEIRNIYVFNTLSSCLGATPGHAALEAASLSDSLPLDDDREYLLIFDQFEELITAFPERWEEREPFFRQIREVLRAHPNLRVLFVIREDHLAELDPYAAFLPDGFRIRYRLERLRAGAALDAIVKPLASLDVACEPGVPEQLVADLRRVPVETRKGVVTVVGEFVEPVHLQVVCQNLWNNLPPGTRLITSSHVKTFAEVNQALASFYERALTLTVAGAKVDEALLRNWFDTELITPAGTRGIVYMGEKSTGSVPNPAVEILEQQRIIRAEPRAGAKWFELTHDRFIEPIRASNKAWKERREHSKARRNWGAIIVVIYVCSIFGYSAVSKWWEQRNRAREAREAQAAVQAGDQSMRGKEWNAAIEHFQVALSKYTELQDASSQGDVLIRLAQALYSAGDTATAQQRFREAIDAYGTTGVYPRKARAVAGLGITQLERGDPGAAWSSFREAFAEQPLETLLTLDWGIQYAREAGDRYLPLREVRRDLLKKVDPNSSPELRAYVCLHNNFVTGASDRVEAAKGELERLRRDFPLAEIGSPYARNPGWLPILVDFFLTCQEAKEVLDRVQEKYQTNPFVGSWYPGCPVCEDLPRRFGDEPPTSVGRAPAGAPAPGRSPR